MTDFRSSLLIKAALLRATASGMSDHSSRAQMLEIARQYEMLAGIPVSTAIFEAAATAAQNRVRHQELAPAGSPPNSGAR
jgi:hypothetical protein